MQLFPRFHKNEICAWLVLYPIGSSRPHFEFRAQPIQHTGLSTVPQRAMIQYLPVLLCHSFVVIHGATGIGQLTHRWRPPAQTPAIAHGHTARLYYEVTRSNARTEYRVG